LENLLRIEVQATEARQLTGRLRFANRASFCPLLVVR
jgi:hypothetical protein